MRAVICRAWGEVEDLTVEDMAPPRPGPGEVLIAVKATAVNYADALLVAGRYQTRPALPFSPGLETAGVVRQCGTGVTRFTPGDRVMAILPYGGLAEQAIAAEDETFAIPDGMRFEEAGAFPIAYISSHVALRWQGRLAAMTRQMMAELAAVWDRLEHSPVRCIILTGAGERAFSAGADMRGDLSADPAMARIVTHALLKHHPFSKPIIAAVNSHCVAGGLELLLSTDMRATVPHARFGLPEVHWSLYPFGGATVKLIQQIGYVHAMELLLTATLIDATTAARLGLVNRVISTAGLMPWALATAATIAANSPTAVQAVKQHISTTMAEQVLAREALDQALGDRVRASPHFTEGVTAFRHKRQPNYS